VRLPEVLSRPAVWRRLHLVFTILWFAAIAPTVLWWGESVLWVGLMSAWANAVGHFGAWQAARLESETPTADD
jgi:hypothetical protein